jgi:hypothetical protein
VNSLDARAAVALEAELEAALLDLHRAKAVARHAGDQTDHRLADLEVARQSIRVHWLAGEFSVRRPGLRLPF